MGGATQNKDVYFELGINGDNFSFSTSIDDAMVQAETELLALNETISSVNKLKANCDSIDYALAASSGALCGIIDIFLIGKPGESPLGDVTDKWFADRTKAFASLCHPDNKDFDSLESALRFLEREFKVPYDQTGLGDAGKTIFDLNAKNHHFKSLSHNPSLLGLFFSILDQFQNTSHFITAGQLVSLQKADEKWELQGANVPSKLFCGFTNWIGHLISDVSGSQSSARADRRGMGIPSPLWTWMNDITALKTTLGLNVTETDKSINELALKVFEEGYDARFQTAQVIPVCLNELLVRLIYSIRRLFKYLSETPREYRSFTTMWKQCEPFSNPSVKRMLTVAHGTFCLLDLGDAVGRAFVAGGGNFNASEFILRLNIAGVGRFTVSLYGETKRAVLSNRVKYAAEFASKDKVIISSYIEGLSILAQMYDDTQLLSFIDDLKNSSAYADALEKSAKLAALRNVPEARILKSKADIDSYFRRR